MTDDLDTKALVLAAQTLADQLGECPQTIIWGSCPEPKTGFYICEQTDAECWLTYLRETAGKE